MPGKRHEKLLALAAERLGTPPLLACEPIPRARREAEMAIDELESVAPERNRTGQRDPACMAFSLLGQ
jgi:hypothetical protein